jgi:predicted ATPase
VERAACADAEFVVSDENAPHVAEICRRLDGIPLAIELAAARVNVLSPKQLARKLDERFRVLTGGDRSALPRHRTMRALIDWSYELLSADERALFRTLSIFAGGFTLESAAAVSGQMDDILVLQLLSSLVDKSLVHAEQGEHGARYRLLESTRQYARERLDEAGAYETVAHAHASAFVALAEQLDRTYETTPDRTWLALAGADLENFRAALTWALRERADVPLGQQLVGTLRAVWGYFAPAEGRRWVQEAQNLVDCETQPATLAALDYASAHLASAHIQYQASLDAAERAFTRYLEVDDALQIARTQWNVGRTLARLGKFTEAEATLTQALGRARALGARKLTIAVLGSLASMRAAAGNLAEARRIAEEALAIARSCGAERSTAVLAQNHAEWEFRGGDASSALQLASESLAIDRAYDDKLNIAITLSNVTAYLIALERYDDARTSGREALVRARDAQWEIGTAFALQHLAAVAALQQMLGTGHDEVHARAAHLTGYVDARLQALRALREHTERQEYNKILAVLRDSLGEDVLATLMADGSAWTEDQAVVEAMQI